MTAQQALAAHRAAWATRAKQLKAYDAAHNEGGEGYSRYERESLEAYEVEQKLAAAAFAEEWTLEVLAERRATWNSQAGTIKNARDMDALAKKLGYGLTDLKKAKALHGIA